MPGVYGVFQGHPRGMVLYGGTSAMGAVMVLEFACVAVCSLLVRQHGSHACQSHAEAFLLDVFVSVSRNDEVMRNNLCGGIAFGLTLVPSHPPALALCVFSRRFVVSLLWRVCLCFSRWSGERVRLGVCQRCLVLVVCNCWPCPMSSWFLRIFWFPELVEVVASFSLALFRLLFLFLVGNYVCSVTCYVVCICF